MPLFQEKGESPGQVSESNDKNSVWVGDITYIPTKQGFFTCGHDRLYSRKVVGCRCLRESARSWLQGP